MVLRSVTDSRAMPAPSHTASVSCLHKNVEFHRINNTYMLHPRLKCPLRASCLWGLASEKHGHLLPSGCECVERNHKAKERFLFVSELLTLNTFCMFFASATELSRPCFYLIFCKQGRWLFFFFSFLFFPFLWVESSRKSHKINELLHVSFWSRELAFDNTVT